MKLEDLQARGPFRASQLRDGDRYELSNGHPIECLPLGRKHSSSSLHGGEVIDSDPDVEWAGVDPGYSPEEGTLRAPDVAAGAPPGGDEDGWIPGVPPLALEYASRGQDEAELQQKIAELLDAGTRYVWVVRLVGPRRVEVYEPGQQVQAFGAEDELRAPGVLRNPVPVVALYDREAAHEVTLRNLLQRRGYESLDAVRETAQAEGRKEGRAQEAREALLELLAERGLEPTAEARERIEAETDPAQLRRWLLRTASAASAAEALRGS